MDQFTVRSIVWASARGDIFWPGEVIETHNNATLPSKQTFSVTVHFFIENSYEDIKNPNKIFAWNCEKQHKFIERGRALKNAERKVEFNKAVAKADNLFLLEGKKKESGSVINGNDIAMNSTSETGKGVKRKLKKTVESEAHTLRKSPRKRMANTYNSNVHPAANDDEVTDDQRLKVTGENPSGQNKNCPRGNRSPSNLDGNAVIGDSETLARDFSAKRIQDKNKVTVDSSLKCDVKRKKDSQDSQGVSKVSTSTQKQRRRGKSSQDETEAVTLADRQRQGVTSNGLSAHCDNNDLLPQRKSPPKRKLLSEDTDSKREVSSRNSKPCKQDSVANESGRTVESFKGHHLPSRKALTKLNGHKDSMEKNEPGMSSECGVSNHQGRAAEGKVGDVSADCSGSSDGSSDDELFSEPFSPSQEADKFSVGDIVWAKYSREPYWPALIKRITGKNKSDRKILVRFLGWHNCLFKVQPKKLAHFACEPNQRAEFLRAKDTLKNKELEEQFNEALCEAEDLLNRKGLGKSLEDEVDEEDLEIFEDDDNDEGSKEAEQTRNELDLSLLECRRSCRAKKRVSKYSDILSYIRQAKSFLKQILTETKPSERHATFTSGRVSEKNNLKRRAGFGPIADENLRDDVMTMLVEFYKELKGTTDISYISDVWLPEAIIFGIQQIDHVDRTKAEEIFLKGSKDAVTSDEVKELEAKLKERKLSAEEAEERLKKAKRAVARYSAGES